MEPDNGNPQGKSLQAIAIGWDPESQQVHLHFNPTHFRTWEFVLGILEMARQKAEANLKMALIKMAQDHERLQAQENAIRRHLERG